MVIKSLIVVIGDIFFIFRICQINKEKIEFKKNYQEYLKTSSFGW